MLLLQTRSHRSDNERKCRLIARSALRAAIARLLDGRPERIDDALTVSNLAYEPASAGRRRIMRSVFSPSSGCRIPPTAIITQSPQGARVRALKAELRAMRGTEIAELHGLVHTPARDIQVLTLQDAGRNAVIERVCGKNWPDPLTAGLSP
ncbi:hypothetical protein [Ensifer sp. ENS12]|uniref:hypothetical protein n=1 Tax=Ensifer sp. ENS12 TaxID=2854774 RepID=UPI002105F04C|nr:hypothetical protein [Ensifer sp. ENS12]